MSYLTKQQTLIEWANLVSQTEITSLKKIQQPQLTALLLCKLDPQYFEPVINDHDKGVTLSWLFSEVAKYYSRQIGTNISSIMDQNINIFSSSAIEQIWELILGIAIKGRNRQNNINTILKMRPQAQQDLMRIISKIINRLGQNVSAIQNQLSKSQNLSQISRPTNETDIILQLTEQNQHLRDKIQQLKSQVSTLKQKNKNFKSEIEEREKQKKQITNIIIKQSISNKLSFISAGNGDPSNYPIAQFIKDIIGQVNYLTKQLSKKQQKQMFYEDVNRDLKLAYSSIVNQLENMSSETSEKHYDIKKVEKQIEELRSENIQYMEREKDLLAKMSDLQQQKFYLKQIIQRLQTKNALSQKKIQKMLAQKNEEPEISIAQKQQQQNNQRQKTRRFLALRESTASFIVKQQPKQQRLKTVKHQVDQLKNPSERNKLQRQVSHLQKKVNTLQQQNGSLKKINTILQKIISQFTKQSTQIIKKYQSQIDPIFKQFQLIIQQQKQKRKKMQEQTSEKQEKNQQKIKQVLEKLKNKIQQYDSRQIEYKKIIKKFQIQSEQMSKVIKVLQNKEQVVLKAPQVVKPKKLQTSKKVQLSISAPEIKKQVQTKKQQKPAQQQAVKQDPQTQKAEEKSQSQQSQQIEKPQLVYSIKIQTVEDSQTLRQSRQNMLQVPKLGVQNQKGQQFRSKPNQLLAASILMQDQQQPTFRTRQHSFMSKNSLQLFNEGDMGFKQRNYGLNKLSSIGSFIKEESFIGSVKQQQQAPIQTQGHIEIVDISQIQEQLVKIKQHYIGITNQSHQLCEHLISKKNFQPSTKKQNKIEQIIHKYQEVSQTNKNEQNNIKLQQYFSKFQGNAIDQARLTAQNIKMKEQNKILKKQVIFLCKQRKAVQQRLIYLQKQSSKSQQQRTKQQLTRLGTTIGQIRNIMIESQNNYFQLQQYMGKVLGNGDKLVGQLHIQIEQLKQTLKQKQFVVEQLQLQSSILMGAVLQFRNNALRTR